MNIKFVSNNLRFLPRKSTANAHGYDLRANIKDPVHLAPGERKLIDVGFKMEFSPGYEAQIRPRSGSALKHGVTVLNSPGTIDADYRGPIGVILINLGKNYFIINPEDRIAQMVFAPITHPNWIVGRALSGTQRSEGGFGSTGVE